jgi:uncharacterized protein YukE
MAEEIRYVYESMDDAYESMRKIAGTIYAECEQMTSDSLRMLQTCEGNYATAYKAKVDLLNQDIQELVDEMEARAQELQRKFDEMGYADIKLGDGM